MELHSQDYLAHHQGGRFLIMKLDLHGIRHEDVDSLVENFVLSHQKRMPLEIVYGNSPDMRSLVEGCLDRMGFSYNDGYQNAYGRFLVIGYREKE